MSSRTIGRAAAEAGVGVETIRFYERRGIIEQPLRPRTGGPRIYPKEAVRSVRFARRAQRLGFSLREIRELLSLRADPAAECEDIRLRAAAKLEEVEEKIGALLKIRSALRQLVDDCPRSGTAAGRCTILQALDADTTARMTGIE